VYTHRFFFHQQCGMSGRPWHLPRCSWKASCDCNTLSVEISPRVSIISSNFFEYLFTNV